jgi:hypothetical protein
MISTLLSQIILSSEISTLKNIFSQDLSNSESGSETGLNCPASTPIDEEAAMVATGGTVRPQNQGTQTQHDQLILVETDGVDLSEVSLE